MLQDFVAFELAREFYRICKRLILPRFLIDQLLRASSSVALNLAEGSAKPTAPEQKRYYTLAFGSFRECEAILALENIKLEKEAHEVQRQLGAIFFKLSNPQNQKTKVPKNLVASDPKL